MRTHSIELELIANDFLDQNSCPKGAEKPNYTNRDFMNAIIIFQTALMDKLWDNQDFDKMRFDDRINMAENCGKELRNFIFTYTNLDIHNVKEFLK